MILLNHYVIWPLVPKTVFIEHCQVEIMTFPFVLFHIHCFSQRSLSLCVSQSTTFLFDHFSGKRKYRDWMKFPFFSVPVFPTGLVTVTCLPPPLFFEFLLFFPHPGRGLCPVMSGFTTQTCLLKHVHSVDESAFSPPIRFVDFFTRIAKVFLDPLRLTSCS